LKGLSQFLVSNHSQEPSDVSHKKEGAKGCQCSASSEIAAEPLELQHLAKSLLNLHAIAPLSTFSRKLPLMDVLSCNAFFASKENLLEDALQSSPSCVFQKFLAAQRVFHDVSKQATWCSCSDVTVLMLDRPRHEEMIAQASRSGAWIWLISVT
jgi:hypothetical protein